MRRTPKVAIATLVITALVAAGCSDAQSDSSDSDPPEPTGAPAEWDSEVTWEPCPELPEEALSQALPAGALPGFLSDWLTGIATGLATAGREYECGSLAVPQDWAEPDSGETFDIGLVRVPAENTEERIGSLVVNPGGPGASGVDAAVYLSLVELIGGLPDDVKDRFDIVGFDPRGVDRSSPVDCFSDADLDASFGADPDPVSQADFDQTVSDAETRVGACADTHGESLNYYSTRQTAHDLDAIRTALGDEQLTYLGYSYGTLLGGVYAHLYPENIRAMVLDGAVDPRRPEDEGESEGDGEGGGGQAAGFERAFDNFANWCAQTECAIAPDARAAVTEAIEQARTSPVPGDGRDATAGWVFYAVVSTLYQQDLWPQLADAIAALEQGDPSGVFTLADLYTGRNENGEYPNMFDANTAINCTDSASRPTVDDIREAQESLREDYPLFGPPLAVMGLDCAVWPGESDPYPYGEAEGAPPIVVIGTTGDPATPYESTQVLADVLGTGVVLTYEGEGHTVYPQDDCINEAVNAYLLDVAAPPDGTTC